jgi:MSHA biogenesis protein MshL
MNNGRRDKVRKLVSVVVISGLVGCAFEPQRETFDLINVEMAKAAQSKPTSQTSTAVEAALLPPLRIEVPPSSAPTEERFSITLNNVPAAQFFMGIASGTRYSMLVHPDVAGTISVNLKNVTLFEALDAVRELYGYDYKVEGTRIYIKPLTLQTRVFQVNYLTGSRKGTSDTRVISGSVSDSTSGYPGNAGGQPTNLPIGGGGTTSRALDTSKISTTSNSDFWGELKSSLESIVGANKEGRSVVISPQSGVVVVRAMWDELRNVAAYLKATQLSVDRQVILDAKIIEVELNNGFQSGINWAAFRDGNTNISAGMISQGGVLQTSGALAAGASSFDTAARTFTGAQLASVPGRDMVSRAPGSLFGLAFQTGNFAALLSFLETQGNVHVLSSPRIATLNNQKAVLKVGRDEFFVTNVSTTTTAAGNTSTTTPSVTVQPFFSGVALDVTPQIDESGNIILHIHPSVSNVTTVEKPINLGTAGSFTLPLASSAISETDSVVRGKDGQVVAIGGLMRQASMYDRSQLPGAGNLPVLGTLFGNTNRTMQKRELVILLKPTIVQGNAWHQDVLETQQRIQGMTGARNPLE